MGFSPSFSPMAEAQSLDGLRGRVLPALCPQWLYCGCLVAVASSRYSEQASAKTMLLSEGIRGGLIHYLLWNKSLLKMREWTRETEWMKSLPRRLECSSLTPGQEIGRRGGKGSERKEEQGEAGATSLHLRSTDGGEGLPVAFTASLLTRGAAVHHMGFGLS